MWVLQLVPSFPYGRWLIAAVIFFALGAFLLASDAVGPQDLAFPWPIALFFCVCLAFVVPVFHFITERTEEAFDALRPSLKLPEAELAAARASISRKSLSWVAVNGFASVLGWLLQSWLMSVSGNVFELMTSSYLGAVVVITPLSVWLLNTCMVHALVDNARLFRRLARHVSIDLLNSRSLGPFGSMAVSSTLLIIATAASLSIMWLDGITNIWTTVPGLIPLLGALAYLFVAPVWPVHKALQAAKRAELDRVQALINSQRSVAEADPTQLTPLLAYRREIMSIPEWPFDLSIMARFGGYLVIVPLTWIGAALIENVVDLFIAG